jgi:rare lipoprotein A
MKIIYLIGISIILIAISRAETGIASWYSVRCNGGTQTASGERLDDTKLTAAHRTLPFGTKVKVQCSTTGRSVVVRINDRGPYVKGRVIDLSKAAAERIGIIKKGITKVELSKP